MTKKEIKKQRARFRILIREFEKNKYDARPLMDEFYRLTEQFIKAGGNPPPPTRGLLKEYWDDPEHYCNELYNRYPVTEVGPGYYKRTYIKKPLPQPQTPTPTQIKSPESHYYRINIIWDNDIDTHMIEQFFEELCIKMGKKIDDHSLSYVYFGGDEGVKILKRALMAICKLVYPNDNVIVYGRQIKNNI